MPAKFQTGSTVPLVEAEQGTIYGQVFPVKTPESGNPLVEIRYFHLWRLDCGARGHPLDVEHVSVLVRASSKALETATWTAVYWYAAAHEKTICDVSRIARASALHAENHGARVWISPGKHASYFSESDCETGCGSDRCINMFALHPVQLINLGEPGHIMNGSLFLNSDRWPLKDKMASSNFPPHLLARFDRLPVSDIVLVNAGRHPAQGVIAVSSCIRQMIINCGQSASDAVQRGYEQTLTKIGNSVRHFRNPVSSKQVLNGQ